MLSWRRGDGWLVWSGVSLMDEVLEISDDWSHVCG